MMLAARAYDSERHKLDPLDLLRLPEPLDEELDLAGMVRPESPAEFAKAA